MEYRYFAGHSGGGLAGERRWSSRPALVLSVALVSWGLPMLWLGSAYRMLAAPASARLGATAPRCQASSSRAVVGGRELVERQVCQDCQDCKSKLKAEPCDANTTMRRTATRLSPTAFRYVTRRGTARVRGGPSCFRMKLVVRVVIQVAGDRSHDCSQLHSSQATRTTSPRPRPGSSAAQPASTAASPTSSSRHPSS